MDNAWDIGVVVGLLGAGLDVTGADLIIGTASQILSGRAAD